QMAEPRPGPAIVAPPPTDPFVGHEAPPDPFAPANGYLPAWVPPPVRPEPALRTMAPDDMPPLPDPDSLPDEGPRRHRSPARRPVTLLVTLAALVLLGGGTAVVLTRSLSASGGTTDTAGTAPNSHVPVTEVGPTLPPTIPPNVTPTPGKPVDREKPR